MEEGIITYNLEGKFIIVQLPDNEPADLPPIELPEPEPDMYVFTFEIDDVVKGHTISITVRAINWGKAIEQIKTNIKLPDLDTNKAVAAAVKLVSVAEEGIYWIGRE